MTSSSTSVYTTIPTGASGVSENHCRLNTKRMAVDNHRRALLRGLAVCASVAVTSPGMATMPQPARVALVLGSGGCRGHAHIGVIRVFEEQGLKPDIIVGCSAGSLVGALHAAGMSASELERHGGTMDSQMFREWTLPRLGMFGGNRISKFVNERIGRRSIESLPTRYAAVATDLNSGELVLIDRGDVATAVQASSSAPGLVEPVLIRERLCVDGSLVAPVPVGVARALGAHFVIACDVSFPPREATITDPFDALYQGFSILTRGLAQQQRNSADLVIAPHIPAHNDMKPATVAAIIKAGEAAARQSMSGIRHLFALAKSGGTAR